MWWGGVGRGGWVVGYDQLCCPASLKLIFVLALGLGCDNEWQSMIYEVMSWKNCWLDHSKTKSLVKDETCKRENFIHVM